MGNLVSDIRYLLSDDFRDSRYIPEDRRRFNFRLLRDWIKSYDSRQKRKPFNLSSSSWTYDEVGFELRRLRVLGTPLP